MGNGYDVRWGSNQPRGAESEVYGSKDKGPYFLFRGKTITRTRYLECTEYSTSTVRVTVLRGTSET
jgi:hypothetical protein